MEHFADGRRLSFEEIAMDEKRVSGMDSGKNDLVSMGQVKRVFLRFYRMMDIFYFVGDEDLFPVFGK